MIYRFLLFILILTLSAVKSCSDKTPQINGLSFVASPNAVTQDNIDPILEINANHVSIMPFGFIRHLNHPDVIYNTDRQWYGETKEGGIDNPMFTPQNKPVEKIIREYYFMHR